MTSIVHLVPGPERHGVVRHALGLLASPALARHTTVRDDDLAAAFAHPAVRAADLVHLHLTDHLLAPSAGECADLLLPYLQARPVSLTLHDLPADNTDSTESHARYERRALAYRAMADASAGVIVASRHEASLLAAAASVRPAAENTSARSSPSSTLGRGAVAVEVVPLPIDPGEQARPPRMQTAPGGAMVAVFGFLYPGKGHAEALRAAAGVPGITGLHALGEPSPGHAGLVDELAADAAELGLAFRVSGHLPEDEVMTQLRAADIPLVPGTAISASGSLGAWLSAGRRPIAANGPYVTELAERLPGAVTRYDAGGAGTTSELRAALAAALADPGSTWLTDPLQVGPSTDECAERYDHVLRTWARQATGDRRGDAA